jgi:branched-chain amino acid transport system substrate-binding protein
MIAYDAMKRGGTDDSTKIRDAIAATKGLELVTGKTEFDKNGDPLRAQLSRRLSGKFKYIDFVDVKEVKRRI